MLFHNDLENTTQALPQVLEQLSGEGYEFVPVSELIYSGDYTIDPNGMQIPTVQSSSVITPENAGEVLAQNADRLKAAGFTDEQIDRAEQAVKSGAELPEVIAQVIAGTEGDAAEVSVGAVSSQVKDEKQASLIK